MVTTCALDERDVELAIPSLYGGDEQVLNPDAGGLGNASSPDRTAGPGPGNAEGSTGADAPPPEPARLEVDRSVLEFGPIVQDTPALGAIRVFNSGGSMLAPPTVELAASDSADFSILQNRCLEPLGPGAECQVRLQFQPSQIGARTGGLLVSSAAGEAFAVELSGVGVGAGGLVLSPDAASSPNFGGVVVGSRLEATFALTNLLDVASGPLTFSLLSPEFQLVAPAGEDCGLQSNGLVAGASCNVRVAFVPTRRDDLVTATLTVVSKLIGGASLPLTGLGLSPAALGVPAEVNFGPVVLGQLGRGTLALENEGDAPLAVPAATVSGADSASFTLIENRCGQELAPQSSCDLSLEFQPVRSAVHAAELVLTSASGEITRVALSGLGLPPGALALSVDELTAPSEYDFGAAVVNVATAVVQEFRITNSGGTPSGALGIEVINTSAGLFSRPPDFVDGDCRAAETSLEPGQGCNVRVGFRPSARGPAQGRLSVTSDLAGSSGVQLLGTGLSASRLALVSPDLIQFNQVITNSVTPADITLRNDGDEPLSPPIVELTPSAAGQIAEFFISANGCTSPLRYQATCSIRVELRPIRAGSHSGSLRISAGAAGVTTVGLTARAVLPGSLTVTPSTASFTATVNGQSEIQTFTVGNPGADSGPLRFNATNLDFELQSPRPGSTDCAFNQTRLAEGQTCTLRVLFDPEVRAAGTSAVLDVTSPNAGSDSVQLTGTAQERATLSGSQSTDFGTVVVGAGARFTWNVTNTGDVPTGTLQLSTSPTMPQDYRIENNGCAVSLAPASSCTLTLVFEPKSQNPQGTPLTATLTLQGTGVSPLSLRATGSGRLLQQPGQRCGGNNDASQCARAGDVCSFNHNLGGEGAICCNAACNNPCQACDATGSCVNRGNGVSCGTNLVCRGESCLKSNGQSCVLGTECSSTNCEPNRDICCATACANGQRCAANGAGCEVTPKANGAPCNQGLECVSGRCVDSFCCDGPCAGGDCEACNVGGREGTCSLRAGACGTLGQVCVDRNVCAFPVCVVGTSTIGQCVLGL